MMIDGSLFSLALEAICREKDFRQRHLIYGYTVVGSDWAHAARPGGSAPAAWLSGDAWPRGHDAWCMRTRVMPCRRGCGRGRDPHRQRGCMVTADDDAFGIVARRLAAAAAAAACTRAVLSVSPRLLGIGIWYVAATVPILKLQRGSDCSSHEAIIARRVAARASIYSGCPAAGSRRPRTQRLSIRGP